MKNRTLGKGLSALLADDESDNLQMPISSAQNSKSITELEIENLVPGKYQPRHNFNDETIYELSLSVKDKGILSPIIVRQLNDKFEIIAGERRWRAAKMAGLETVPVIIKNVEDSVALEIAILENLQRESLTPIEEAAAYKKLAEEFSYSHEQLSKAVGKSRSHVTNMLRLLSMAPFVQKMVDVGALTVGHAKVIMPLSFEEQEEIAKKVGTDGMSVRDLEGYLSSGKNMRSSRKEYSGRKEKEFNQFEDDNHPLDDDLDYIQKSLSENLGMRVMVQETGDGGRMVIHFSSLEQLDKLIQLLSN
ncbi:MAG: ParB/RepB/Spo0J family partition protein [Alphaproteobacteria bacterium]|nr:ParB/RepB/Spo0J family partition protein [Alphaproteobacteria bacterium]